jgi:hypothetical protein
MDKKPIRLTEQDLHFLVENAVQAYLTENGMDEGFFGGLGALGSKFGNRMKTAGQNMSNAASQKWGQAKNAMGQAANAVGQTYNQAKQGLQNYQTAGQVSSINQDAQKAINNATQALNNLIQLSTKLQQMGQNPVIGQNTLPVIQNCLRTLQQVGGRFKGRRTMAVS